MAGSIYTVFFIGVVVVPIGIVSADNRTVLQTQPLYRCAPGSPVLSLRPERKDWWAQDLVTSNGTHGAHGGSGLSAVGGTIRWWELMPGAAGPKHALKIELYSRDYYFRGQPCFRWPAICCCG